MKMIPPARSVSSTDNPEWKQPVGQPIKSQTGYNNKICRDETEMSCRPTWRFTKSDPKSNLLNISHTGWLTGSNQISDTKENEILFTMGKVLVKTESLSACYQLS